MSSRPGTPVVEPAVAEAVRLLHRRQGWGWAAVVTFFGFLLAAGAYSSVKSQGASSPLWFVVMVAVLGFLTIVDIVMAVADTAILRRRPRRFVRRLCRLLRNTRAARMLTITRLAIGSRGCSAGSGCC